MMDVERLLSLAETLSQPDTPDMCPTPARQVEPLPSNDWPDMPDSFGHTQKNDGQGCDSDGDHQTNQYSTSLYFMSGMSGVSGQPAHINGFDCPTDRQCMSVMSGSGDERANQSEEWRCPLKHRHYWVSHSGMKICSTCHPQPRTRRRHA